MTVPAMCAARRSYHLGTVASALEICAAGVPHNATSSWRFWQRRHARHSPGIFACPAFQREVQHLSWGAHDLTVADVPPVLHSSAKLGVSLGVLCRPAHELGLLRVSSAGAAHASALASLAIRRDRGSLADVRRRPRAAPRPHAREDARWREQCRCEHGRERSSGVPPHLALALRLGIQPSELRLTSDPMERALDNASVTQLSLTDETPASRAEPTSSVQPPRPLGPGDVVGAYRIVSEIGRGAMGVVFLAIDEQLERKVGLR